MFQTPCLPPPPLHVIYLCFRGRSVTTTSKTHSYSLQRNGTHIFFDILQSEDVYFLDVIIRLPPDSQTSIAAWTAFQEWLFCHGTKQSHYIQLNCHGNFVTQNTVINFAFISLLKCHKRPFKIIISLKKEPFAFDFERG